MAQVPPFGACRGPPPLPQFQGVRGKGEVKPIKCPTRHPGGLKLVLLTVLDLCLFFMPDPPLLDPVSLFLTDERSDAAVVGSGNKAMKSHDGR